MARANLTSDALHPGPRGRTDGPCEGREGERRIVFELTGHRSSASGGLFSAGGAGRGEGRLPIPADSVVDPRIGASGPALLALEDGTVFDGVAFGARAAGGGDL